ncbi:MAG: TetR/AcrR family transcriptional regulator [Spirochaetes bacterium]|nr:TetR/AcrR family transcriptional regulator [Spirochaetota bacterium]
MDKEAKMKEKKKVILDALKKCLEKDVYSNITVQDVATESGFSKGGLLHYFSSKEDMYIELIQSLFNEIREDHSTVLHKSLESDEKASLSALFGIEKFFMDTQTVKILLNLLLYSFEDRQIAVHIQKFLKHNRELYENMIIESSKNSPRRRKTDLDPVVKARIAQILVLLSGIIETVDPINMDHTDLVKYIMNILKN